jgi:hypothetical protein
MFRLQVVSIIEKHLLDKADCFRMHCLMITWQLRKLSDRWMFACMHILFKSRYEPKPALKSFLMLDSRFSRHCFWRVFSFELKRLVVRRKPAILKEHMASISGLNCLLELELCLAHSSAVKTKETCSSKSHGFLSTTRPYYPEDYLIHTSCLIRGLFNNAITTT